MPYPEMGANRYVGSVVPDFLTENWRLHVGTDRKFLPMVFKGKLDLFHYDSDKTYYGRLWSYRYIWTKAKSGFLLVSDDIQDNFAFKDFCDQNNLEPLVFKDGSKYIGTVKK